VRIDDGVGEKIRAGGMGICASGYRLPRSGLVQRALRSPTQRRPPVYASYRGTYVALMAEVRVDAATGSVKVGRIVCAQDMGVVINPDGATMQMEGCIMMGLGYTLSEEVRFNGGQILTRNFDTYEVPRFSGMPEIETVLVKNDELTPQGGGEPAIVPVGAVVANAIFDATGARLFEMPMTAGRVKEAVVAVSALGRRSLDRSRRES
jgi:CO/xanthine dehydrogenase Mo-binding subunit